MSLVPEQSAFLRDVCSLLTHAHSLGYEVTGGELYRTSEQQMIYVKQGKSKTQNSNHLRRLAIDLYFFLDGSLVECGDELERLGHYWVGLNPLNRAGMFWQWKDTPHFERNVK